MFRTSLVTRRTLTAAAFTTFAIDARGAPSSVSAELQEIEKFAGGQLGVFARQTEPERSLALGADVRFLMCSTFKLLAAAGTLDRIDNHHELATRRLSYSASDLVEPHPVTGSNVQAGSLPLWTLCEAAVAQSDSTAANLLMRAAGGPAGLTGFIRSIGDGVTRIDRYELAANTASGDLDTTTPKAVVRSVHKLLLTDRLSLKSRQALEEWMRADQRGLRRLRAGFPPSWMAGSKPGTSPVVVNDVAVLRPPSGTPVIVGAFYRSEPAPLEKREAVLASVGRVVAHWVEKA
ncbi:MAG: class A beta-lactamase [Oxalobacteraceae bacterium]|nr:MAG: class A beta-lactamase [Oxalobacteraceae bacterium]